MATIEKNNAEAIVDAYVKQNGNNEITGDIMNTVLKTLIGYALRGLHFLGVVDSGTSFPTNTPFFGLAIGADTIEGVTIPANALACVYNNGETGDTNQVEIILSADALIAAHNTSNTAHGDIRTEIADGLADLQDEIDALSASSDVTDVVGTYTDLQNYDTSGLTANDIIKVLEDSTHDDSTTYYRWILVGGVGQWQYIGEQGAYYTKAQADAKFVEKESGKGLSSNDFTDSFKTAVENLYNLLRITGSADNGTYLTTLDNIKGIIGIGNRVNASYLEFLQALTSFESSVPIKISTPSSTSANTGITITAAESLAKAILAMADGKIELIQKDANDNTKAYIGLFANSLASLMFANGVNFTDGGANKQLNTTFGDITLQSTTGNVDLKSGNGKVRVYGQNGGVEVNGQGGDVDVTTENGKKMKYNGNEVTTLADIFTMIGYNVLQVGTANTLSANVINIIYNNNQLTSTDTLTINGTTNRQALSYIRIGASMPTINGTAVGTIIGGGWKLNSEHLVLTIGGSVSIVMPLNLDKTGVISQTQTWSGNTYIMSDKVTGPIPISFIDKMKIYGADFNETTGYFELNGLTDISYEEMQRIEAFSPNNISGITWQFMFSDNVTNPLRKMRTNFFNYPKSTGWGNCTIANICRDNNTIETLCLVWSEIRDGWRNVIDSGYTFESVNAIGTTYLWQGSQSWSNAFNDCAHLKHIDTIMRSSLQSSSASYVDPFKNLPMLETVWMHNNERNINWASSPNLKLDCIRYVIANRYDSTVAFTITLHPDCYARCQADTTEYTLSGQTYTGIIAYAAARYITIASA